MTLPVQANLPVLVIAGMHRSGTSLVASLLHHAGCSMGDTLLAGDPHNRPGYFEDVEFLDLNRRMLASTVSAEFPGHVDWGWTEAVEPSGIERERLSPFVDEAGALIARRRRRAAENRTGGRARAGWGWKDPRNSMLLDFWDARLGDAGYVFVYRPAWDVADSMQRLGADVFLRRPDFAYRIWHHYNQALLTFARQHRDRTLLVSSSMVLREPQRLLELIRSRFGIDLDSSAAAGGSGAAGSGARGERPRGADPSLFMSAAPGVPTLAAAAHVECTDLLRELEATADLPSGDPLPPPLAAARAATSPSAAAPQVAVVVPCFNHGEFLLEAIASVERSVTVPYELIIVNDGSTDRHTIAILARLRQAGYRIVEQSNRGLAAARNRGIRETAAPFVIPLDADNRLRPGFVTAALEVLAGDSTIAAVYGDRVECGQRSGRVVVGVPDVDRLLCGNYIDACAVIRRHAWEAAGGYDGSMPVQGHEDWDLWLSLLERGFTLHRLDMETFDYRVVPGSMLSRSSDPELYTAVERYVLAKHAPFYLQQLRRQVDRLQAARDQVSHSAAATATPNPA